MNNMIANVSNHDTTRQAVEPAFVGANDVARLLSISPSKLHQMKQEGKLGPQGVRFGRAVRYDRSELLAWARAGAPSRERWQTLSSRK